MVMAEKLGKAAKLGQIEKCFIPSSETQVLAIKYCELNFSTDYEKFKDCKIDENFCYVCCENEFGDLHVVERDKCYNKCDKKSNTS